MPEVCTSGTVSIVGMFSKLKQVMLKRTSYSVVHLMCMKDSFDSRLFLNVFFFFGIELDIL